MTVDKSSFKDSGNIPILCTQRWIMAILFSTGFFFVFALRVNLSVALVCMVEKEKTNASMLVSVENKGRTNHSADICVELDSSNSHGTQQGEFDWDKKTQSSILAAFFYGYIITQIPGGWLSDRFGGYKVFGVAMGISGICTILLPVCARASLVMVYVLRFILGFVMGVVHPACYSLWGRWAPRYERTILLTVTSSGAVIGIVTTFSTGGLLCEYGFDNGWASIFYISGGLCCLWVVLWFVQVRDTPAQHPRITEAERIYIENNTDVDTEKKIRKVPWISMMKSVPLWALLACHFCGNWADYTLMTNLPTFMKEVLKFDIKSNGALSALPYICNTITALAMAKLADILRRKSILTTTLTRKILQSIAYMGSSIFLVATGFVPCTMRELAVAFLCIAVMCTGISAAGYGSNHVDLAPKYAGILIGITNTAATLPGMISPIVAGALTPNGTSEEWRSVFYVSTGFYVLGAVIFAIFGSGELQPWGGDKAIEIEITSNFVTDKTDKNQDVPLPLLSTDSSEEY